MHLKIQTHPNKHLPHPPEVVLAILLAVKKLGHPDSCDAWLGHRSILHQTQSRYVHLQQTEISEVTVETLIQEIKQEYESVISGERPSLEPILTHWGVTGAMLAKCGQFRLSAAIGRPYPFLSRKSTITGN